LHHYETSKVSSKLAGNLLPDRLTFQFPETDSATWVAFRKEYAPPIIGEFDVGKMGPALLTDVDSSA
jgi:hypothetical protein